MLALYKAFLLRHTSAWLRPLSSWALAATASWTEPNQNSNSDPRTLRKRLHHSEEKAKENTICSSRGQRAVELLPSYLVDARAVETYSSDNPNGALQLGVAEWQGLEDLLVPALNTQPEFSADCIYYQPTPGRLGLKRAMANYIETLVNLPQGRLDTDGLVVGAGCNAVLENLCICLAEAGDAVLIPTPYYAAFEFDLGSRAALTVEPVTTFEHHNNESSSSSSNHLDPRIYYPNTAALDAAYERAASQGHRPRILLLSHPQNPLGICYPSEVVQECIDWCRENKVHLISDEIYAGSVYNESFESILQLANRDNNSLGDYIHWVYALSKDFGLSGLRVGAAYTENKAIQLPLQKLNDLCQISSTTQVWTEHMLSRGDEEPWTTVFRRENHARLASRSQQLMAVLDEYDIPYLKPTAGLFLWMDLSAFLPSTEMSAAERERHLYLELVHTYGLLLTPGKSMRNEQPGFFRCVFTAATDEEFALALERLRHFCTSKRT